MVNVKREFRTSRVFSRLTWGVSSTVGAVIGGGLPACSEAQRVAMARFVRRRLNG